MMGKFLYPIRKRVTSESEIKLYKNLNLEMQMTLLKNLKSVNLNVTLP